MDDFSFKILNYSNQARCGILSTPNGEVKTPAFIFCATKAAIKSVDIMRVTECDTQIILSNTYHLMLQPGEEVIEQLGGLHKVMGWKGPMLTDSGGFQVFSLGHGSVAEEIKGKRKSSRERTLLKIDEGGALFRSYINGKTYYLTPEKSIQIQKKLGADLIVVLDECTPFNVDRSYTERSMHMSHRWAKRCLIEFNKDNEIAKQRLYGIIQGGVYQDLRKISCDFSNSEEFFGIAIGGSLGANKLQMYDIVGLTMSYLAKDRPIHLLGIGGIRDVFIGVELGIDTFDCVHPTRLARHGGALVKVKNMLHANKEHINLHNSIFKTDATPIESDCLCFTCKNHSKGYIHHLLKAREMLACTLITIHNIHFMNHLMKSIRTAISNNTLLQEKKNWVYD